MAADTSSGIEPVFALSFTKNVVDDDGLQYVNRYFREGDRRATKQAANRQATSDKLFIMKWHGMGVVAHVDDVPKEIKTRCLLRHMIFLGSGM
jgi:ribonucleotide reductase alpha subunit